jgi:hypothetical protein
MCLKMSVPRDVQPPVCNYLQDSDSRWFEMIKWFGGGGGWSADLKRLEVDPQPLPLTSGHSGSHCLRNREWVAQ